MLTEYEATLPNQLHKATLVKIKSPPTTMKGFYETPNFGHS